MFRSPPTAHIARGASDQRREYVAQAVRLINEVLPFAGHLRSGHDAPASFGNVPFGQRQILFCRLVLALGVSQFSASALGWCGMSLELRSNDPICPKLVVLDQTPDDSILDMMFVAVPPSGLAGQAFEPIEAHLEVEDVNQTVSCVIVYAGLNQEMACLPTTTTS